MSGPTPPTAKQKAAYQAGGDAFVSGAESTTCPHAPGAPEGLQMLWVRGYVHARQDAGVTPPALPRGTFVLKGA